MVIAAQVVSGLQTIPSRMNNAADPIVLSIGTINGGNRFNIIAGQVTLTGTFNEPSLAEASLPVLASVVGRDHIQSPPPQMGAEDFALCQERIPGLYFFLGVGNAAKKITAMIHTEYFDMDEDALPIGVRAMSTAVLDYLYRPWRWSARAACARPDTHVEQADRTPLDGPKVPTIRRATTQAASRANSETMAC